VILSMLRTTAKAVSAPRNQIKAEPRGSIRAADIERAPRAQQEADPHPCEIGRPGPPHDREQHRQGRDQRPSPISIPASIALRDPSTAAVRNTMTVSRPGVIFSKPAAIR
jgi:hypothetical protein